MNACELLKTALLTIPVPWIDIALLILMALGGGSAVRLYMSYRWHRGIRRQKKQEMYERLFKRTQRISR